MRRLEGGDDPLGAAQQLEGVEHLVVGDRLVAGPTDVGEVGVLGPDARVVEAGGDRLGLLHLADVVLHEVAEHPVHDARHAVADGGAAGRLDADQLDVRQLGEPGEDAGGVRAAADAGDDDVGVVAVEQRPALLPAPRRR